MPGKSIIGVLSIAFLLSFTSCVRNKDQQKTEKKYSGSASCRECHEKFYTLWATSHHGLAMQPITAEFIQNEVQTVQDEIFMEEAWYKAIRKDTELIIQERKGEVSKEYKVLWALGGKNVYYFLTAWEGGRLQTLPLAYDVHEKKWYNNPESAVRHFPEMHERGEEDSALSWRDYQYTFNTSCYGCHVSQLSNNYDLATNTYQTIWEEPGINCETCHGPSAGHVRVCREAGEGKVPEDLKIIMTSKFTPEQHNASCAPCHARMSPITSSYVPGDRYFDNYDLVTLENSDFYPDGRDLGENYTMTGWHMNPCARNSDLHCVTCHTSSGRYRFKSDIPAEANKACTSCHTEKAEEYEKHTHHKITAGNSPKCVDCHMPMTRFGNMVRSDHSFRPPMPATSMKFGSPNACNICHKDKDAQWANQAVNQWKKRDYQKETLHLGGLLVDARSQNWNRLNEMLDAIRSNQYGEVYTTSFIRLLSPCLNPDKWPVLLHALNLESPLSRSAAALALLGYINEEAKTGLFKAALDEYRLVRLAAAQSLVMFPRENFTAEQKSIFQQVNGEYEKSLVTRSDDWSAYYNLGNHFQNMGNLSEALNSYENSLKINPQALLSLVNSSFLYSVSGDQSRAQNYLERALTIDPANEAANLNYGLLMAEMQKMDLAEKAFRKVLEGNKNNSTAAYNLSIIVSSRDMNESCRLSKQAMDATPDDPKFAYTHAYFLNQNKQKPEALKVLETVVKKHPGHLSSVFLLGSMYTSNGNPQKAIGLYQQAIKNVKENPEAVMQLQNEIERTKAVR